ncbi:MAG: response regulator transcription factor [Anaerolineae bacterium]
MDQLRRTPLWLGIALIVGCVGLLALSLWPGAGGPTVPAVVCLGLAAAAALLLYYAPDEWYWRHWLYVPAATFASFGIVFLFNAITSDWGAWGYAWLLCIAGAALGTALAARAGGLDPRIQQFALWVAGVGVVAFCVFGAVASGPFMRAFTVVLFGGLAVLAAAWVWRRLQSPEVASVGGMVPGEAGVDPAANAALVEPLSPRELDVLRLIDSGLSNAEIADRLVVAQSTVKTHINSVYGKLGAKSRTHALRRAKELGLL